MWSAKSYLEFYFLGQPKLVDEIHYMIDRVCEGENFNFLFQAPSGYGKTYLAQCITTFVSFRSQQKRSINYCLGNNARINIDKRFQIFDEAHLIKEPEIFYPEMDSGIYTFMILTNEYDILLDPFVNRCFIYSFEPYSEDDLTTIIEKFFRSKEKYLPYNFYREIVSHSRLTPREVILMARRLLVYFSQFGTPKNIDELDSIIRKNMGIEDGGFTSYDSRYLEFLRIHERASLDTLCNVLQIPRNTIKYDVEPFLIRKGLISITPRGRILL